MTDAEREELDALKESVPAQPNDGWAEPTHLLNELRRRAQAIPPAMAATGAQPGPGEQPVLTEGTPNV